MTDTNYITELRHPSLTVVSEDGRISPVAISQYLRMVENERQSFVAGLSGENKSVVSAYREELEAAIQGIYRRGYCSVPAENLTVLMQANMPEGQRLWDAKNLDEGLLASARRTLTFISSLYPDLSRNEKQEKIPEYNKADLIIKKQEDRTISGTRGLADYLGCCKTTAFALIKTGILKKEKIQYKVGRCWRFDREKLDRFLVNNPEALGTIARIKDKNG